MSVTVSSESEVYNVDLAPSSVAEEVLQNIRVLLGTYKGSVPFDRDFGISIKVLDLPPIRAKAKLQVEILEAIQDYEPRATVLSIGFKGDEAMDGILVPVVEIAVNE